MELALYHPVYGYYRRGCDPFGQRGDFYTAEQLPPFGDLVAALAADLRADAILELGSGRGELRNFLGDIPYQGIDWNNPLLPEKFSGLVIANEFFDALPVHLLERNDNGWSQLAVDSQGEAFAFSKYELTDPELLEYAARYERFVVRKALLEANIQLAAWFSRLREILQGSQVLVIDYGYSAEELRRFPAGTLLSYHKHAAHTDVLRNPGECDITSHVNFSELLRIAEANRFSVLFDGTLRNWALSLWDHREFQQRWTAADEKWKLQWKQLVFGMGETFRVVLLDTRAPITSQNKKRPRISGA
jgi:SAM-dependent MidA family methyltransferase